MSTNEETVATLAATLVNVQKNQDASTEFHMNAYKRIMEKLDVLPTMQTSIAVMNERLTNLGSNFTQHISNDEKIQTGMGNDIEDLKKESWIKKGIAMAAGGIAGFGASLIHK